MSSALAGSGAPGPIIQAEDVSASIESSPILKGLTFEVDRGRLIGLLGPNGSGKTTLMRCISGLLPYGGRLVFDGRPVHAWRPGALARKMAFVRQAVSLSFDFTVSELVLLGRSPHKRWMQDYSREDVRQMEEALHRVDLDGFRGRSVLSLSGGELQRVMLAQALVQEAEVLLLDEPTAHLDVHYQFEFMDLVADVVRRGCTAIAVFHDLEMAARYADDLIVLNGGRIAAAGRPRAVLTEDLIADVFRMQALLHHSADRTLRIEYVSPIRTTSSVTES